MARKRNARRGAVAVEYVLILAIIVIPLGLLFTPLGGELLQLFDAVEASAGRPLP